MNKNYFKNKKKFEILSQNKKKEREAQKYIKLTEEMIKEFNRNNPKK